MKPKNEHLPLLHAFNNICQNAYNSWHLVTSPVLAKVGLSDLFQEYSKGGLPPGLSKLVLFKNLIRYYLGGCFHFFFLLCCKTAHALSRQRTIISTEKTVFIDTYCIIANFLKGEDVLGHYFSKIRNPIADAGWKFVVLPRFYGTYNPFAFYRIFSSLRAYETPVLTEFQILTWRDYLTLFVHVLYYPWRVLSLLKFIPQTREGLFIRFALINGLNHGNLLGAVRYFVGRRIALLLPKETRCLQWFENQTFERCFNRGLREAGAKMPIYGAQLLIWPPELINIHINESENSANMPDVLLVNGPYYKNEDLEIPCRVGPSMRYATLFDTPISSRITGKTLVLLPQFEAEACFTFKLAVQFENPENLMFKPHPTLKHSSNYEKLFPIGSIVVKGSLYNAFYETSLLIGSSSGSLVEAAVVGIPVIIVSENGFPKYSYMPNIGKGILWEHAMNLKQLHDAKKKLFDAILHRNDERLAAIETLRKALFIRPTSEGIMNALDLR